VQIVIMLHMDATIIAALITAGVVIAGWFAVPAIKSWLDDGRRRRTSAGLVFSSIRADSNNKYWRESKLPNTHPHKDFSKGCLQYFRVTEVVDGADPSFEVMLLNDATSTVVILSVGVEILRIMQQPYELPIAGPLPTAHKLDINATYEIDMPSMFSAANDIDPYEGEPWLEVKEAVLKPIDPYVLESGARFRYTLFLRHFSGQMPNSVVLRMCVSTEESVIKSHPIYLRYSTHSEHALGPQQTSDNARQQEP
jgi:hypothetical protein